MSGSVVVKFKMPSKLYLFIITLHALGAMPANTSRTRRDLPQIQNFARWLFGVNGRNFLQTFPLIENFENDRLYTIPAYEKLIVGPTSQLEINKYFEGAAFTDELCPRKIYRANEDSIAYPAIQAYINDRYRFGYYRNGRPMFPFASKPSTYRVPFATLNPTNGESSAVIPETKQSLSQPPLLIQNRMRDVINQPISPVNLHQDNNDMTSPNLRQSEVSKYPLQNDSLPEKKIVKFEETPPKSFNVIEERLKPIPDLTSSELDSESNLNRESHLNSDTKKKVPHKNTVVKMYNDIMQTAGIAKEKGPSKNLPRSVVSVKTDRINSPVKSFSDISKDNKIKGVLTPDNVFMSYQSENRTVTSETSFKNDELPITNAVHENTPAKVKINANRDCKLTSSLPQNGRGDIPEHSLRCL